MIMLGIETSGDPGSVALCTEETALAACALSEGTYSARSLMPAVDDVVRQAGIARTDIAAVAVSQGPGAFTGLRVGVTCAKTLAYALGWKLAGVPSLEVLVQNATPRDGAGGRFACPVRDARRGRVYGTVFEWDGTEWRDTTGVLLEAPQELAARVPAGALVFGSGVDAHPQAFGGGRLFVGGPGLATGRAEAVARLGLRLILSGKETDPMALLPRYYRLTEAEEKLRAAGP